MKKNRECKVIAAVMAAALLLTGCNSRDEIQNNSSTIKTPSLISKSSSSVKSEPAENDVTTTETDESPDTNKTAESTETIEPYNGSEPVGTTSTEFDPPTAQSELSWREWDYSAELFINARVSGRTAPTENSEVTRIYELDEPVSVVAFTSTHFFKLSNGDYIFAEYFSDEKGYSIETVRTELTYEPPMRTEGRTVYDPKKALDYAKEHWQEDESLCAGFGSECLTAGGLDFDETSSTKLFNRLVEAGLGYAVAIDLNEDGTANVPDFVYPGDIIFYYCKDENMMVHTAVYNGDTKDGFMKAYAHNLPDNGEQPFRYFEYCVGGCGCPLDKIVAFCFYRDDSNIALPTGTPKLSAEIVNKTAQISWTTDFVYRDSELVITDSKGKIISRTKMGTDKTETLQLSASGGYVAYVIFTVYDNIKVRSDNLVFKL